MLNKYAEALDNDGVIVVKSVYKPEEMIELKELALQTHEKTLKTISKNPTFKDYLYYTHFDKERCSIKKNYQFDNIEIIEIVKGRYDINCNCFTKTINLKIMNIINNFITKQ